MVDRQPQRRGNESFRLGCAPDSVGSRYPHLDAWSRSRAQRSEFTRWGSRRNDLLHGFRDAAGRRGGRSHAGTARDSWSKAHRTASLAYVLWPFHRGRVFFSGALKPPAEIVFGSGARATSARGFI